MRKEFKVGGVAPGLLKGTLSATGGEPVDAVSREIAVPIYKLEQWRDRAQTGIDAGLKERENDPLEKVLDDAKRQIGDLVMEVEILQKERRAKGPLVGRRLSR